MASSEIKFSDKLEKIKLNKTAEMIYYRVPFDTPEFKEAYDKLLQKDEYFISFTIDVNGDYWTPGDPNTLILRKTYHSLIALTNYGSIIRARYSTQIVRHYVMDARWRWESIPGRHDAKRQVPNQLFFLDTPYDRSNPKGIEVSYVCKTAEEAADKLLMTYKGQRPLAEYVCKYLAKFADCLLHDAGRMKVYELSVHMSHLDNHVKSLISLQHLMIDIPANRGLLIADSENEPGAPNNIFLDLTIEKPNTFDEHKVPFLSQQFTDAYQQILDEDGEHFVSFNVVRYVHHYLPAVKNVVQVQSESHYRQMFSYLMVAITNRGKVLHSLYQIWRGRFNDNLSFYPGYLKDSNGDGWTGPTPFTTTKMALDAITVKTLQKQRLTIMALLFFNKSIEPLFHVPHERLFFAKLDRSYADSRLSVLIELMDFLAGNEGSSF
jgi:hypothetical protein